MKDTGPYSPFTSPPPTFTFTIPTLPKAWWQLLSQVRRHYTLSVWQGVILALKCLQTMGKEDETRVAKFAAWVKDRHPAVYR